MSTSRRGAARVALARVLLTPFPRSAARGLGLASAAATFAAVTWTALLVLRNIYGPLGDDTTASIPLSLGTAVAAAASVYVLVGRTARRSVVGAATLVGLLVAAAWVLLPRQVDRHESFMEEPNERSACSGWSIEYYPPETFDASVIVYCVGLESPLPYG